MVGSAARVTGEEEKEIKVRTSNRRRRDGMDWKGFRSKARILRKNCMSRNVGLLIHVAGKRGSLQ